MKLSFRAVTMEDAELLLSWKNEEDTRKNSIATDAVIQMEDHLKWLSERVLREEFYIILLDDQAVGDVRLEGDEISIRMDKKYRGMGLATQVIAQFPYANTAKIRTHNVASMRVFLANGFRPAEHVGGEAPYLIFKR